MMSVPSDIVEFPSLDEKHEQFSTFSEVCIHYCLRIYFCELLYYLELCSFSIYGEKFEKERKGGDLHP